MMSPVHSAQNNYSDYGQEYKDTADNLVNIILNSKDSNIVDKAVEAAKKLTAKDDRYFQEVSEIRDYALLNMGVVFAKKKEFGLAITLITSMNNFKKMATGFEEISQYIENQEQMEKVVQAAKNTLNQGNRKMTLREMRMLPELLNKTQKSISSVDFDVEMT